MPVLCLLLITSQAWGAAIQIDASALTHPSFRILPLGGWIQTDRSVPSIVNLAPGSYTFQTNSNTAGYPSVPFQVTSNGTVTYDLSQYAGILEGWGTPTLKVKGTPVTINTRALSDETVDVDGLGWSSTSHALAMTLIPGRHELRFNGNTVYNYVFFTVGLDGTISYGAPAPGGVAGAGTATVLVRGSVITLDAKTFTNGLVSVDGQQWQPTRFKLPFVLVSGTHELRKLDAAGNVTTLYFTVGDDGLVGYSPGAGFSGSGTDTLTLL